MPENTQIAPRKRGRPPGSTAKEPPVSVIMAEIRDLPPSRVMERLKTLREEALRAYGEEDGAASLLITHADVARDRWLRLKHKLAMLEVGDVLTELAENNVQEVTKMGDVVDRTMNPTEKLALHKRLRSATEMLDVLHGTPSKQANAPANQTTNNTQITQTIVQAPKGAYAPPALPAPESTLDAESETTEGEIIHADIDGEPEAAGDASRPVSDGDTAGGFRIAEPHAADDGERGDRRD